jgi:serine/threonine-protein kinase OSR1/STK39
LFVVDITGFQLSQNSPRYTAIDALTLLLDELELYQPGLANRPALLAVNKVDLPGSRELYKEFQRELREVVIPRRNLSIKTVIPMSVHDGFGVAPIKVALRKLLEDQLQETPALQANFQNALFS